jgi:hypothetical protein
MLRACLLGFVALSRLGADDSLVKPDKISIHTWVREDMFAGWIGNDDVTFERGVAKVDRYLSDHPTNRDALAWKFLAASYHMIHARAKGDGAAYVHELARSKEIRARMFPDGLKGAGALIIVSASLLRTACVAPDEDRAWMFHDAREMLLKISEAQDAAAFDAMPAHMRGELWGEMAFVAGKTGNDVERDLALNNILTKLPNTSYATRATAWQKAGVLMKEKDYTCLSCHEPGRLEPTLTRLNNAK